MKKTKLIALLAAVVCTLNSLAACNKTVKTDAGKKPDASKNNSVSSVTANDTESERSDSSVAETVYSKPEKSSGGKTEKINTFASLSWTKDAAGRLTTENQPSYVFDEDAYYGKTISGGSYVRTADFVRGLCPQTDFGSDGPNDSQDRQNFSDLRVTSHRCYGGSDDNTITSNLSKGVTTMPTWNGSMRNVPRSYSNKFNWSTGKYYESGFQFAREDIYSGVRKSAQKLKALTAFKGLQALLLANEYCNYNYGGGGYDDSTLKYFRTKWLPSRFGTVANMNKLTGTSYKNFGTVMSNPAQERGNIYIKYEFWLCLRSLYEKFMKFNYDEVKAVNPGITVSYASYHGNTDPYSNYARIGFMDAGAMNIYREGILFSATVDQQLSLYNNKPFYITETAAPIFDSAKYNTPELLEAAYKGMATRIKKYLPLAYMRPQVQGTYYFSYCYDDREGKLFNIVDRKHMPNPAFYGLKQCYEDFEFLDSYYTGSSSDAVVAVTNAVTDELTASDSSTNGILKALYANGVTVSLIDSDINGAIKNCGINKLILCDKTLYSDPDGGNDAASEVAKYAAVKANSVISLNAEPAKALYGSCPWNKDNFSRIIKNVPVDESRTDSVWKTVAPFIHGDFVSGNVSVKSGTINSSAVRILDASVPDDDNDFTANPVNNIQQQLVYKNGHLYLCVVNTGSTVINNLKITLGINNGVKLNLHPEILRADGKVTVNKPKRATAPKWMSAQDIKNSRVTYGTVTVDNLSSYAFIDLGMAVTD